MSTSRTANEVGSSSGRERLLRTLRGQPVDRMPIAPFLYYNAVYEMFDYKPDIYHFYDPPDFDVIEKFVEYCDYFGFDVMHVLGSVWDQYLHSTLRDRSVSESDENWDVEIVDDGQTDEIWRYRNASGPIATKGNLQAHLHVSDRAEYR